MMSNDLKYAFRSLAKRPGYTFIVVLILALGIGATTAIFSLVNAAFIEAVPFEDPESLVVLLSSRDGERSTMSLADLRSFEEASESFESLAGYVNWPRLNLTGGEEPQRVRVSFVTPSYFEVLGIPALLGRTLGAEDDLNPGGHPVAVISHTFWQSQFNSDPEVPGTVIELADTAYTIVGVMPEKFQSVTNLDLDLWVPMMQSAIHYNPGYLEGRQFRWMDGVGRLKAGVTLDQARQELSTIAANLETEYPATNKGIGILAYEVREFFYSFNNAKEVIQVLSVGAIFVLLIGCFNIATLLLARASERNQEMAVRQAMGANRSQVIRQSLVESLLLSALGGLAGFIVAWFAIRLLFASSPLPLPAYVNVTVDPLVFVLALLLTVVTGIVFGLLPARKALQSDLQSTLKPGARGQSGGPAHSFGRRALVIVQIAASVLLLFTAGLLYRSFQSFQDEDLGFKSQGLLTVSFELSRGEYADDPRLLAFYRELQDKVGALPQVESAGIWGPMRPGQSFAYRPVVAEGNSRENADDVIRVYEHRVSNGGLRSIGLRLLQGRLFEDSDTLQTEPVAVVSRSAAEALFPGEDPIGRRIDRTVRGMPNSIFATVVGLVEDANHRGRESQEINTRDVYLPLEQGPIHSLTAFVLGPGDIAAVSDPLRDALHSIEPSLALYDVETMQQRLDAESEGNRFNAVLMGLFAIVALILTTLGIYGILSYAAARRTQEIGLRMALGAEKGNVMWLMVRRLAVELGVGVVLGIVGAWLLRDVLSSLLWRMEVVDVQSIVVALVILVAVSALATALPLRRALGVSPVQALRYE